MKTKIILKLILIIGLSVSATYAQEITLTTTTANTIASRVIIDMPALSNNPDAIIVATLLGRTATLNPHPIGAWYYNGKWSIFNTNHTSLPMGATFKVEVFLTPDANHFLHLVTKENLSGEGSYLDNPALNNNPKAQFKILQNHAPDNRSNYLNKFEAKAEYNAAAGKWAIKNVNGEPLYPNTAYNVVITSTGNATVTPTPSIPTGTPFMPPVGTTLAAPTLTVVVKTSWDIPYQGNGLQSSGQCGIVSGSYTNPNILATDTVIVTGQAASEGRYLIWTAAVENGAIHLNVCNFKKMTGSVSFALDLNGRKVNILVLR